MKINKFLLFPIMIFPQLTKVLVLSLVIMFRRSLFSGVFKPKNLHSLEHLRLVFFRYPCEYIYVSMLQYLAKSQLRRCKIVLISDKCNDQISYLIKNPAGSTSDLWLNIFNKLNWMKTFSKRDGGKKNVTGSDR